MRTQSPSLVVSSGRSLLARTIKLRNKPVRSLALLALIAVAATALAATSSSAQLLFGKASAMVGLGSTPAIKAAPVNSTMMTPNAPLPPSDTMLVERRGHSATRLSNGTVLIAGGENSSGALNECEIYDPSSATFSVIGNMGAARADHSASLLADGRVLIAGGRDAAGALNTTEIFDPTTGAFAPGPAMSVARAGHSATLFADGRVFIAGGDANGSAEILDVTAGSSNVGSMNTARSGHSAALMLDGRILVVGGRDADGNELSSGEIFDGANFIGVGGMVNPRVNPLMRVLFDGKVQIIGGSNDGSMEIYDPAYGIFGGFAHVIPESDTCAGLPGQILNSPTRAALFHNGQSDPLFDRTGQTITEMNGQALVLGGADSGGAVLSSSSVLASSSASITTDKIDYVPGQTATISGRGFQAGETVRVKIHEDPHTPQERGFDAVADADGNFSGEYVVQDYDQDMKFIVGARGLTSGATAQTTFTDAVTVTPATGGTNISADKAANSTSPAGGTFSTIGNILISENLINDFSASGTLILSAPTGWQFNAGAGSVSTTKSGPGANELSASLTVTTTTITVNIIVTGTGQINTLTISGIQVKATDGANLPSSGNILRTGGTATIPTITGTTNFGSLSQAIGIVNNLVVTLPTQTFTDASTVAASGNSGSVNNQTAGTAFNITKLTATDQFFNVVITYTGAKTISYTGPGTNAGFPAPSYTTAVNFTSGVSTTVLATTLRKAETTTITASDGTTAGPASSNLTVNVGALSTFAVTNTSDGPIGTQTAGTAFDIKLRAVDSSGNTDVTFNANGFKANITSSGTLSAGAGNTPAFVNGVLSPYSVTFSTSGSYPGSFTITATSIGGGGQIGTSNAFTVNPPPCTSPSVTTNPTNLGVTYGAASASFTAAASGTPAPSVQWQVSTGGPFTNLSNTAPYSGGTTGTLLITGPTVSLSGNQYRAVFTNTCVPATATSTAATLTVNKAPLTVTADNKSREYGDANPTFTASYTGFVNSETLATSGVTGSPSLTTTATPSSSVSGSPYAITAAVGTLASNNYSFSFVNGQLTVTKATLNIDADDASREYGDANPTLTATYTGFKNSETLGTSGVTGSPSLTTTATPTSSVAGSPYTITAALGTLASGNYSFTFSNGLLTITKATLTVTADSASRQYGDANPTFTASYAGFKNSEVFGTSGVTGSPSLTTTATPASSVAGSPYAITAALGTLTAGNYQFSFVNGQLTITTRPITVTADAQTKVYGAADPSLTYQITSGSLFGSDAFTGALTRAAGESVAGSPYAILQGTLALDGNYYLSYTGANLTITARDLTVNADPQTKVYGDSDPALTYTHGALFNGDTDSVFSGSLVRAAGEAVGPYAISQGTLSAGGNYNIIFTGANLTITARDLTVNADPQTKVYGDSDPALTYTHGALFNGDTDSVFSGSLVRAAGEAVGPYAISQGTLSAGGNYNIIFTSANLTITARDLTVNADPQTKVYGDGDPALTYTHGALFNGDTDSVFSGSLVRAGGEAVGSYAISIGSLSAGGNYNIIFTGANLTITARDLTVNADPQTKVYGDGDPALTYTHGALFNGDTDSVFSGSLVRAAGEAVSTYAISQGSLSAGGNYNIIFTGANLTIDARAITITADAKSKTYGDADPALTYLITSGTLAFSDAFTGSLSRDAGESVGSYAITQGTVALSSNYALTYVGANLTINARAITITADAKSKTYGDADPALTYLITSGTLAFSDAFTGSLTRDAGEAVGSYAITQGTVALSSNYALTYVGANLTINARAVTITADAKSKTYGDADPALTYAITSGTLAFSDTFTGALSRDAGESVGSYAITQGTVALSSNYALTYVGANLAINARAITITADPKSKTYGDADPALTYQITSGTLAFSDAFTGALSRDAGESVGSYAITQGTVALSSNYALTYVGSNLTINARAVTITADAKSKTYGDADPALTYAITSGTLAFSDAFTGSLTRDAGEAVSAYTITQGTVALSSNYALTYVGANLTINARPITITADAKSKTYGDADPALTYQITSGTLAFSDAFTGSLARDAGEAVGNYAITQGTVALSSNYALTYVGANLTITPRTLTVNANHQTKVYGAADPSLSYVVSGLQFTDTEATVLSGSLSRAAGEAVGNYPISQGSLTANGNYIIAFTGNSLDITARPITVTADAGQTKVYSNADPAAFTYSITSGSLAFSDAFSGALSRDAGESVGSYAINQNTLSLGTNYTLTYVGANFAITARPVTVTADAGQTKVYGAADPASFTYSITSGSLAFSDAFSGALSRDAGENVGSYAINQGSLSAGPNYNLTYAGTNFAITSRPVTVTADAGQTKVYGNADPAFTYSITSGSLAFSDAFSGALSRAVGENVGTYAINQGTLALNGNYTLTYVGANFAITVRPVTVTATAGQSKVYGNPDPASYTYSITSGSLAFADTFSGALTRVAGETVGNYAINQGTLSLNSNYALTYVGANFAITARPITITADAKTKVYGAADPALTYQLTSGSLVSGDAFTGSLTRAAGQNVGTYAIQQGTVTAGSNYALTYISANLSITPKALTITADNKSMIFGGTPPALTATDSGYIAGESRSNLTGSLSFTVTTLPLPGATVSPITTSTLTGTYAIVPSGLTSSNYTITYVNGTLTVGVWTLTGFYQPVDMPNPTIVINAIKGGSTVPLKFNIYAGTPGPLTERKNITDVMFGSVQVAEYNCATISGYESPTDVTNTGATSLRYDTTGAQFIQNWQTPKPPNKCYQVRMTAIDGSHIDAYFKTK